MVLFAEVVDAESFTAAAARVGLSKQTVSERIGKLEEGLGVRLLHRTTRSLRLTDAGARYYTRCAAIAAQVREANAEARGRQREVVGRLRVSVPTAYGRRFLVPLLAGLLDDAPDLVVEVVLTNRHVNLVDEGFDAALRVGELPDSSMIAQKIGVGDVHDVASPAYLDRHGSPTRESFARARHIGFRPTETWRRGDWSVEVEPVLVVNDLEMAHDAALAGIGIARLPSFIHGPAVERGELVRLFGGEPAMRPPLYVLYPSRRYLPVKVERFIEAIRTRTAEHFPL